MIASFQHEERDPGKRDCDAENDARRQAMPFQDEMPGKGGKEREGVDQNGAVNAGCRPGAEGEQANLDTKKDAAKTERFPFVSNWLDAHSHDARHHINDRQRHQKAQCHDGDGRNPLESDFYCDRLPRPNRGATQRRKRSPPRQLANDHRLLIFEAVYLIDRD